MFIVFGLVGAVLLVTSLLFDDWFDELVPDIDFLSGIVLGAFLSAFGLFGWFAIAGLDLHGLIAIALAFAGGLGFGWVTYKVTKVLIDQPTDATPTTESLVGATGRVVTPVRAGGIGEVIVDHAGAATKYTATADDDLATGSTVVVISVESPTKVRVQAEAAFWS